MKSRAAASFGFGLLGTLLCLAVGVAVMIVSDRLTKATGRAFEVVDEALEGSRQAMERTAGKVREAGVGVGELERSLKDWTKGKAVEAAGEKLGLREKSRKVGAGLETVSQWLEVTESSVRMVEQGLQILGTLGLKVEHERAGQVAKELAALRGEVEDCRQVIATVGDGLRSAPDAPGEPGRQLATLAGRAVLTLAAVDERFEQLAGLVAELEEGCRKAGNRTLGVIRLVAGGLIFLVAWMAAGQIALCLGGWRGLRAPAR